MLRTIVTSLPMFVCGILSVLLLLNILEKKNLPKQMLLIFMAAATLLYAAHCVFFQRQIHLIPITDTVYSFCNPAVFPLYLAYILRLTSKTWKGRQLMVCLLPASICCICVGLLYCFMSRGETAVFIEEYLYNNNYSALTGLAQRQGAAHIMVKIVFAAEIIPVCLIGFKKIERFNRLVENYYADTEHKTLSNIKTVLILFIIVSIVSFLCNAIGRHHFTASVWLLAIPSVFFSVLIFWLGYIGYKQDFSILEVDAHAIQLFDNKPRPVQEDLQKQIIQIVSQEELYLQPNLKITDLAQRVASNRNYIYQAINVGMGSSFSEFMNRQRVEYAARLMKEKPDMTIAEVALKSGFSSPASFYRNFKLYLHCSPKEYKGKTTSEG